MSHPLVFIGAGRHLSVAAEIARINHVQIIGVLDPALKPGTQRCSISILGGDEQVERLIADGVVFHISITVPTLRRQLRVDLERRGAQLITLAHPSSIISATASVDDGCLLAAGTIVNPGSALGRGVVVNTGAQIDHDCRLGADTHIGPGVILAGSVHCGDTVFIASGAIIGPNIRIGAESTIGAGSTVLTDVREGTMVVGSPAAVPRH